MKIVIVDENDNPIGLKERDALSDGDIHRVSALWISNAKGEVLLAQRALRKKNAPGKWGPAAAGTVDEGESYEDNIVKEVEEEIGVTVSVDQLHLGQKDLVISPGNDRFRQWFMAKLDIPLEALRLQEDEVMAVKWVSVAALEKNLEEAPDDFIANAKDAFPSLIAWTRASVS